MAWDDLTGIPSAPPERQNTTTGIDGDDYTADDVNDLSDICAAVVNNLKILTGGGVSAPSRTIPEIISDMAGLLDTYDALQYKGAIDCSGNPNYPAANAGHVYKVSVAGKIGGASGKAVRANDIVICSVDSSAAGTEAAVGANWDSFPGDVVAASTSVAGIVQLSSSYTGTSETKAVNEKALKDGLDSVTGGTPALSAPFPRRQTVLSGAVDANGFPNFLAAGAGPTVDADATPTPIKCTWMNGWDSPFDLVEEISSDVSWTSLTPYANPFLYVENDGAGNLTRPHSLYRPHYGVTPPRGADVGSICATFQGSNGATTYTDLVNNVFTFSAANATISTAEKKYGSSSLRFAGTNGYVTCQAPNFSGKWTIGFWARFDNHTGTHNIVRSTSRFTISLIHIQTASTLQLFLSSNGSSFDIANAVDGTAVLSDNTWYWIEIVFTGAAYKVYIGAGPGNTTEDISVTSSASMYQPPNIVLGIDYDLVTLPMTGYIGGFHFYPYALHSAVFAPPAAAITPPELNYGNIDDMKMYKGNHTDGWTQTYRLFIGECKTDDDGVTSVTTYALQGRYDSGWFAVAVNTYYYKIHNMGLPNYHLQQSVYYSVNGTDVGAKPATTYYVDGSSYYGYSHFASGGIYEAYNRLTTTIYTAITKIDYEAGAWQTTGYYRIKIQRAW